MHKFSKRSLTYILTAALLLTSACSAKSNDIQTLASSTDKAQTETNESVASETGTEASKARIKLIDALKLKDAKGAEFDKGTLSGKSVLVTFWTTWCQYCKDELSSLNKIAADYKQNDKFQILLVNVTNSNSTVEMATNYLKENAIDLPIAFISQDDASELGIPGFPFNLVLNQEGNLTKLVVGDKSTQYFFGATEEQLRNFIKQVAEA